MDAYGQANDRPGARQGGPAFISGDWSMTVDTTSDANILKAKTQRVFVKNGNGNPDFEGIYAATTRFAPWSGTDRGPKWARFHDVSTAHHCMFDDIKKARAFECHPASALDGFWGRRFSTARCPRRLCR